MDINVLLVDDDLKICEQVSELLNEDIIKKNKIKIKTINDFNAAKGMLKQEQFDIVVLDLFRGKPSLSNNNRPGEKLLEEIKSSCFIPVIFFTGVVGPVEHLRSDIVRVVRKSDGTDKLKQEIENVLATGFPFIRRKVVNHLNTTMSRYFWGTEWNVLENIKDDVSLGYLLVRNFARSLSKKQIIEILGESTTSNGKSHPMEFYIYPLDISEYGTGDLLKKDDEYFVLLTPSCDFVKRDGKRKAEFVMLSKASLLTVHEEYVKYKSGSSGSKEMLKRLIENRKSDRYFFLPKTPFLPNCVLDFQNLYVIKTETLEQYKKIARLDDPYAQSMLSRFIRYYNRIGSEDIDTDYIIKNL